MPRPITIQLSPKEYQNLVEMIQIADWVITAHESEESEESQPYRELRHKVLSHLEGTPLEDCFQYDEAEDQYFEKPEFDEEGAHRQFLDEFENQTFWEELIERLADRDVVAELGDDGADALNHMERYEQRAPHCEKYAAEFQEHGLKHLELR